jgi:SAM-dependent methyltransferase
MNIELKLYYDLCRQLYSTAELVRKSFNPLREYDDEFMDGPVLDLGCGQSSFAIEYAEKGREIYAVDNDASQLKMLQERIAEYAPKSLANLHLCNVTLLKDSIPGESFALVNISNLLHFFSLKECAIIIDQLVNKTRPGAFIQIVVHSERYYMNNPDDPDNNDYFKHYFTEEDVEGLFPNNLFEKVFLAHIQKRRAKLATAIIEQWLDKVMDYQGITDQSERQTCKNDYLEINEEAQFVAIFKRK